MTLAPALQHWYLVGITLAALDGSGTTTVSITNRPALTSTTLYKPLLIDINGLNFTVGQDGVAVQSAGSILIADTFGSFGEERRFSDLFERYTICEQDIYIADATTAIDSTNPSFTIRWRGLARSVSKGADTVTISIDGNTAQQRYVSAVIDATLFPNAPAKSLGKRLPVIFGSRDSSFSA